jgi:5-methylthioadenosine/S-adenosylhomocysteine deaminase
MRVSEMDLVIDNAQFIVTSDSKDSVLRNYAIGIKDKKIAAIQKAGTIQGSNKYDARGKLIAPGLINAHTHLAMTLLRGWAEGVNLQSFLEKVWAAESFIMSPSNVAIGTQLGALESLLSGTTTTVDMYLHPDSAHRGAALTGIRHITGPIFLDFSGLDGLEWEQRLDVAKKWTEVLKDIGGPEVPVFLMPHSTYTVSPDHLVTIAKLAMEMSASINIHASENLGENEDVYKRFSKTPTAILKETGILNSHTLVGHGIHLTDEDIQSLASAGAAVAHCPSSNLKLGSGIADVKKFHSMGLSVALGTDGCSSSNDLDLWTVMRTAANLYAHKNGPENLQASKIFRMATIEAAQSLGLESSIGSIEVGKSADLISIDLNKAHLIPLHDVFAQLVFAVGRGDVSDVWVEGKQVVVDGKSPLIDFIELSAEVEVLRKSLNREPNAEG